MGNQPRFQDSLLLAPPGYEVGDNLRFSASGYHLDYKNVYYREQALRTESIVDLGLYLTFFYSQGRSSVAHKILFMN